MTQSFASWTPRPTLPVDGSPDPFPVSRVFGIGRNYATDPTRETKIEADVVLFSKDAYLLSDIDQPLAYPSGTARLRYEVELVVAIGRGGGDIAPEDAMGHVFGYAAGIDFTKYDVQDAAKSAGRPWESGKSFPGCGPCSRIVPRARFQPSANRIWLDRNGKTAQSGHLGQMIWTIPELICLVSARFTLKTGDLIFSGTPEGVGMTARGDRLSGGIEGLVSFAFNVV